MAPNDPRVTQGMDMCLVDSITLVRSDGCTLPIKDLPTSATPPSIFNETVGPMKRVARKGPGARDDVDVPADKVRRCGMWCGVVVCGAVWCGVVWVCGVHGVVSPCRCGGDGPSLCAPRPPVPPASPPAPELLQLSLLSGPAYAAFLTSLASTTVADEAEDSAVGVATSSVRAAHVVPPRFSRHLHLRPCIEVLHEDGKLYCADIVCAYTTREGRRAARVARKSSNPGDRTACVQGAPVCLVLQWWAAASLPAHVLPGGVLSHLTNVYGITSVAAQKVSRRVLPLPLLGPLDFKGHPTYAPPVEEMVCGEDGKAVSIRRRFAVLVSEPYFCD